MALLDIQQLHAQHQATGTPILRGVDLAVEAGQVHVIMGKNGSGKSTLARVVAGHPEYQATKGSVQFLGKEVLAMPPHERAQMGIFLGWQAPRELPGVSMKQFLHTVHRNGILAKNGVSLEEARNNSALRKQISLPAFSRRLAALVEALDLDPDTATRGMGEGFSGGEKKKTEILTMQLLQPKIALLDEVDSGLDAASARRIAEMLQTAREGGMAVVLITHHTRMLRHLRPDRVHLVERGRIAKSGGAELAQQVEEEVAATPGQ